MTGKRSALLFPLVLACATAQSAAQSQQPVQAGIAVKLEAPRPSVGRGDDVLVRVTLSNTSSVDQHVLRWRTPLDGVRAPLFEVRRDGQPARYLGVRIKRPAPQAADFVRLEPGASVTQTVELSSLYEMHITGAYTVRYSSPAAPQPQPDLALQAAAGELASGPVSIWVEGRLPRGAKATPAAAPEAAGTGSLAFSQCSNAQQDQLVAAVDAGRAMTLDAHAYLAAKEAYGPRYATWFGAPDLQRGQKVGANFAAIKDAFETRPLAIDCGCDEPYFAYVYPAQPYKIYVCKAFWSAANTGTDSRGGTLVHEMSHFDAVAGTDDHVYGQAGAAELARTAPDRAVNNADSHEYFGENTPVQSKR
ncbi:M35 family metallo-endopeptidase [Massilia sp. ST3]|uniref:M35 family metallo-endopeptidase n=1 Tax=Massilia sp. ST3 TaxID=2824903 RepID=UPI001B83B119|nr:M35 family metallo-endopeptidase [Massilia sp. ST3]MBQ5948568.1 peptidase M35 [Massilia sp. ST3]